MAKKYGEGKVHFVFTPTDTEAHKERLRSHLTDTSEQVVGYGAHTNNLVTVLTRDSNKANALTKTDTNEPVVGCGANTNNMVNVQPGIETSPTR
jgi:hypothetical protein